MNFKTVGQIMEGHFKKTIDKVGLLPEETKKLSEIRFAACTTCDTTPHPTVPSQNGPGLRDNQYCRACGCDMQAKTKVIEAKCPIGRW
ncbi:MAG: hypothetical protein ACK5DD_10265 [Cyclobacteriaceae bacterium]|jgi:hypothetical protein